MPIILVEYYKFNFSLYTFLIVNFFFWQWKPWLLLFLIYVLTHLILVQTYSQNSSPVLLSEVDWLLEYSTYVQLLSSLASQHPASQYIIFQSEQLVVSLLTLFSVLYSFATQLHSFIITYIPHWLIYLFNFNYFFIIWVCNTLVWF